MAFPLPEDSSIQEKKPALSLLVSLKCNFLPSKYSICFWLSEKSVEVEDPGMFIHLGLWAQYVFLLRENNMNSKC